MMMLMAALLAAADRPVVVSSVTTAQLLELCRGKDTDPTPNFCTGYIRASNIEVVSSTRKYLRRRAKPTGTGAPSFVVRDALQQAFPCKRK
jgi:hypothetical protein